MRTETKKNDCLYVIWQDNSTRLRYKIGYLTKEVDKYVFEYDKRNISLVEEKGFKPLISFPDINRKYESNNLFSSFLIRIPDKRRSDIDTILQNYGLNKFNEFELLKATGGRLPIDNIEFVIPIDLSEQNIHREFFIAGVKYHEFCNAKNHYCKINKNELLQSNIELELEPNNKIDNNAVKIKSNNKIVGYITTYYAKEVKQAINLKRIVNIKIIEIKNDINNCHECIKAEIYIE